MKFYLFGKKSKNRNGDFLNRSYPNCKCRNYMNIIFRENYIECASGINTNRSAIKSLSIA